MTPSKEKIITRIQKLLALSKDSNSAEAASAAALASRLLTEHNLTLSEVEIREERYSRTSIRTASSTFQEWEIQLSTSIARLFSVKVILNTKGRVRSYLFFGTPTDSQIAAYTFEQLRNRLTVLVSEASAERTEQYKRKFGTSPRWATGQDHPKAWRTSWLVGAVLGIRRTVQEQIAKNKETIKASTSSTALIHLKDQLLEEAYSFEFPELGQREMYGSTENLDAQQKGYTVGRKMDIRPGLEGSESPRLPG